jgi:hypothetical protein
MTMNALLVLRERRAIEEQRLVGRLSPSLWLERYEDFGSRETKILNWSFTIYFTVRQYTIIYSGFRRPSVDSPVQWRE